jgi:hypothetical protein
LEKLIYHAKRLGIFLITLALAAGMVGCGCGAQSPSEHHIPIWDWYDLNDIRDNLGGIYVLMTDLDSNTAGYGELASPTANHGKGWEPIGTEFNPFKGYFDGQEYEIRDLDINRPDQNHVGLFGYSRGAIKDTSLVNVTLTGKEYVGGLVGRNDGTVSNSHSTGSVTGERVVGGLVGWNADGEMIINSSTCSVTGTENVGGLVGFSVGEVSNSHSTGSVTGEEYVGGLVGCNHYEGKGDTVSDSHSKGNVTGTSYVGGLVGYNDAGDVINCYSTGNVTGKRVVGGLVGWNAHGLVIDSHSAGDVTGEEKVDGLVGWNSDSWVSPSSYYTGSVTLND